MALANRIIPCLDVDNGRVVKGVNFVDIKDAGDPVEIARRYNIEGADELCMLDITATHEDRNTMVQTVQAIASEVFIPLTVGGGIRTLDNIKTIKISTLSYFKTIVGSKIFIHTQNSNFRICFFILKFYFGSSSSSKG